MMNDIKIIYTEAVNRGSDGYRYLVAEKGRVKSRGFCPAKSFDEFKDSVTDGYMNGKPISEQGYIMEAYKRG